jgi:ferrous iron transport protein B
VFALQCTSTIVVMARETGSWRWPAFAFTYMLGLAWTASFVTYHLARGILGA